MIVKNADNVLEQTLSAIKPYIDNWTILDTESTDDTVNIINRVLGDIEGNLYIEPFIDFASSRNRVLELAGKRCKYVIMLDDSYILKNGEGLRDILKNEPSDTYTLPILDKKSIYYSTRIFDTSKNIKYFGRVHEITNHRDTKIINYFHTNIHIHDYCDALSEARSLARLPYYLKILSEDHEKRPDYGRPIYYLASTYYNMENYEKALEYYKKRIEVSKIEDEEVYRSYYLSGCISMLLNRPIDEIVELFQKAFEIDKDRAEPLYQLGVLYYKNNMFLEAKLVLEKGRIFIKPFMRYLQVDYNIYDLELPCLLAEVYLKLKLRKQAKALLKNTIDKNRINHETITRMKNTLETMETEEIVVKKLSRPVLVLHTGTRWDIDTYEGASGSEYMAVNICKVLSKKYNIIMFVNDIKNKTMNGINYMNSSEYENFLRKYYVDILIVSRFTKNLYYFDNIEKVFLWLHDTLPIGDSFQTHSTKFKGVLTLCNWHKELFCQQYGFPENWVHITRNGIDLSRFNKDVEKTPLRFIYTSSPLRGLDNLIDIFPKILARYPTASLYIFAESHLISSATKNIIKNYPQIQINDRLDQDKLAEEFLKSDIWLYPTNFKETYCITALEAQYSRVLCATYKIGSLPEIIGNRGILADGEDEILKKLFLVLDKPVVKNMLIEKAHNWAKEQSIEKLAYEWQTKFF